MNFSKSVKEQSASSHQLLAGVGNVDPNRILLESPDFYFHHKADCLLPICTKATEYSGLPLTATTVIYTF